jgi:hypothetical protein
VAKRTEAVTERGSDTVVRNQARGPQIAKRTPGSWSPTKEDKFLIELGRTCNVTASARYVGMSVRSAYHRRAKDADFRAAWTVAIGEGYQQLELVLLQRAIGGDRKPVFQLGKQVGSIKDYPDRIAITLLTQHRLTAKTPPPAMTATEVEEARAKLLKRLRLIRHHNSDAPPGEASDG